MSHCVVVTAQDTWNFDRGLTAVRSFVGIFYWLLDNWYWAQKMEMFMLADTARINRARIGAWLTTVLLAFYPAIQAVREL